MPYKHKSTFSAYQRQSRTAFTRLCGRNKNSQSSNGTNSSLIFKDVNLITRMERTSEHSTEMPGIAPGYTKIRIYGHFIMLITQDVLEIPIALKPVTKFGIYIAH